MEIAGILPFSDRIEAGRLLASKLDGYKGRPDVVVVGLPRGGVPVAFEVAQRLRAPLDVLTVRKLRVPWQRELAMGSVASGGIRVLDHALIRSLNLSNYYVYGLIAREESELARREALYHDGHPAQVLSGRTVILIDDGAATGSTMLAAREAVVTKRPKEIVIAVPVASCEAYDAFKVEGTCFCLATPEPFFAVGQWYESFPQISDEEVKALLCSARAQIAKQEPLAQWSSAS
jgi:putative phosphoribosyl transferase